MAEARIKKLLKEMEHGDQDNREMAAADLCTEIERGAELNSSTEKVICQAYIKQLSDSSLSVQGNAVKCISKIGSKISEKQFGEITNKLTECVVKGTDDFRDIYATCLKTLISEADETFGKTLCGCLLPPLSKGTGHKLDTVREQCIEITNELLKRFNGVLISYPLLLDKDLLMGNLIQQLPSPKAPLRKRACACLGSLVVVLNPKQANYIVATLLKNINPKDQFKSYPYIETIGAIANAVGYKLAPNLVAIVGSLKEFCKIRSGMDATVAEQDYNIKEVCLTVFESAIKKCPKEVTVHLDDIMKLALELVGYDPNYNPDVVMGDGEEANMEEWGEIEEEQGADDDSSWKVRKAAVRLLATLVRYRYDKVMPMYDKIMARVIERLVEREESIKCLLLEAFTDLVKGVVVGAHSSNDALESAMQLERKSSSEYLLKGLPGAVSKIVGHYEDKSMKVREAIASLLLNMALAVPDYMNGVLLGTVLPKFFLHFKENNSTIKITIFQTLRRLMRTTISADGYIAYLPQILDIISLSVHGDYFKLPAEALMTAGVLVKLLMREAGPPLEDSKKALVAVHQLCVTVFKHPDVDQEIKQAAIYAAGIVAANASGILTQKDLENLLATLHDRLKYEALRLSVIKAFHTIVTSNRKPPIEKALENCMPDLVQMTRKIARQVKLTALETILGTCDKFPSIANKFASTITNDVLQIIREGDLQLIQLALKVLLRTVPLSSEDSLDKLLEALLTLCGSPLIQAVLDDAIPVLSAIAKKDKGRLSATGICEALWTAAGDKTYRAVSAAIAPILSIKAETLAKAIETYTAILGDVKAGELHRKMAAIIIGHIGHSKDLSSHAKLNTTLTDLLKAPGEELKIHAAICLGNIALGNKAFYVPMIISKLKASQELSYLMLVAIREIVVQDHQHTVAKELAAKVLPALHAQADTDDEGDRTIIAEILGKLLLAQEEVIGPEVEKGLVNSKENVRATFALSFKYWTQKGAKATSHIPKLLELLKDKSLKVQKALLESLTNIARQNATLLRSYTAQIQSGAIPFTVLRPDLIKTVDLGPLQHKIDEGEPVRKGAYTLIENMISELYDKMDLPAVVERLIDGLGDESDEVQNACQQVLIKICEVSPSTILAPLEKILDQIMKTVRKQADKLRKMQDVDRAMDNIRAFLRVLIAMNKLPEIDLNQKYQDTISDIMRDKTVSPFYEELNKLAKAS